MTPERPKVPSLREAAERFALPRMELQWRVSRLSQELDHGCVRDFTREDEIKLLRFAIAADEELHKEIVAVLREAERVDEDDDPWSAFCAVCHRRVDDGGVVPRAQHKPDCRLAALLHRLEPTK